MGRIKDRLITELVFTNLHMMETLFTLIGAFTFEPENPWIWINNPANSPVTIAKKVREGEIEKLYKNLESIGVKTLDDYIVYLFYNVPTTKEHFEKIKTLVEPTKYALKLLSFEFFDKRDLYNAYKHGSISMPVKLRIAKEDKGGNKEVIVPPFSALMYLPKRGKKSSLEKISGLESQYFLEPVPDYIPLNYEREKGIAEVTLNLIRNIINVRKALVVEKSSMVPVVLIPDINKLKKIFTQPVLQIERISLEDYKKMVDRGEL